MRLLGLDQSLSRTGWCLLTGTRGTPQFEVGSIGFAGATDFCQWLAYFLDERWPQYVVWERPNPRIMIYGKKTLLKAAGPDFTTPNAAQLVLPQLAGMIEQACYDRDIAYESVAVNSWRARVMGKGYGNLPTAKTKQAALAHCELLKIEVKNADQAEAALIALYGLSSQNYRLMTQRSDFEEAVAADPLKLQRRP